MRRGKVRASSNATSALFSTFIALVAAMMSLANHGLDSPNVTRALAKAGQQVYFHWCFQQRWIGAQLSRKIKADSAIGVNETNQ